MVTTYDLESFSTIACDEAVEFTLRPRPAPVAELRLQTVAEALWVASTASGTDFAGVIAEQAIRQQVRGRD